MKTASLAPRNVRSGLTMPMGVRMGEFFRYLKPLLCSSRRRRASGFDSVFRLPLITRETVSLDGLGYSGSLALNVHPRLRFIHPSAMLA